MIESEIDIRTEDGAMNTFVVHPETSAKLPVVLFYMDGYGKREELHEMARRIAASGYLVVLPNLYYRRSRDFRLKEETRAGFDELLANMRSLDSRTTLVDTAAMLEFVAKQPSADVDRTGAVGYCMGGRFVVWAAAANDDRLRCIASIHGAEFVSERADSPHLMATGLRCESYFACAENDDWAPPDTIALLERGLRTSGSTYEIDWYAGAGHGFAFPSRREAYSKAAADRHWIKLLQLFDRTLGTQAI